MSPRTSARERAERGLNRSASREDLELLAEDRSEQVRVAVAMNPATPQDVLMGLVDDPSSSVRRAAVDNLGAGRAVWEKAMAKGGESLLWVAQVPWLSVDLAEELARHEDWHVREAVARATVWRRLLTLLRDDPRAEVRAAVAGSPRADLELWGPLAADPQKKVRAAVALNPLAPTELLAGFVHDRSSGVRWAVVSQHPHKVELERLFVDDVDDLVRSHARMHVRYPATRTFRDDGSIHFSYPQDPDPEPIEAFLPDEPIGREMLRQASERQTKRRAFGP